MNVDADFQSYSGSASGSLDDQEAGSTTQNVSFLDGLLRASYDIKADGQEDHSNKFCDSGLPHENDADVNDQMKLRIDTMKDYNNAAADANPNPDANGNVPCSLLHEPEEVKDDNYNGITPKSSNMIAGPWDRSDRMEKQWGSKDLISNISSGCTDPDSTDIEFNSEMATVEAFLNLRHKKRIQHDRGAKDNSDDGVVNTVVDVDVDVDVVGAKSYDDEELPSAEMKMESEAKMDAEDYGTYMQLNGASPHAIRQTFLYCIRTDDVGLAHYLLRDVGIEYILRHCLLYDGVFSTETARRPFIKEENGVNSSSRSVGSHTTVKSSSTSNASTSTHTKASIPINKSEKEEKEDTSNNLASSANLFWLAALHGSVGVLDMVMEECVIYFVMAYCGEVGEASEETLELAKADLASILNEKVTVENCTPLYAAAAKNHASVISKLLRYGANPNGSNHHPDGISPAIIAASKNNVSALQALGENEDIDFNWASNDGRTPILAACCNGCVDAVKYLVHYNGVNDWGHVVKLTRQDKKGYGCASLAARYNHQDVIQFLCQVNNPESKVGVNINQRNRYDDEIALHIAARHNCVEVVQSFVEMIPCDCDVGAKNQLRMTALHVAASKGHTGVVKEIVTSLPVNTLARFDYADKFSMTPLFYALYQENNDCVKLLGSMSDVNRAETVPLGKKLNVNDAEDDFNALNTKKVISFPQTPLVVASMLGLEDIVYSLLHCGAQPDLPDGKGNTPLSRAAEEGNLEIVEILVTHGAGAEVKNRSKAFKMALYKARRNKHHEIVEYLEKCAL
mmetsp:Transcript_19589/g.29668  ORF Transcript_19589/g.29668 Transcript_19589/m.29668 type:complete len:796 (+) Transcript_19589:57-2444(+)